MIRPGIGRTWSLLERDLYAIPPDEIREARGFVPPSPAGRSVYQSRP